jgi:hypothetical protein
MASRVTSWKMPTRKTGCAAWDDEATQAVTPIKAKSE